MSLFDAAAELAKDYSRELSGKRWQSYLFAAKLRDLRLREGWTQKEVATRAGISESAVRNYEQQKSNPKQGHLESLARAFGIRPEALRLYDFEADSIQANAIFQLGETYGLKPGSDKRFALLSPANGFMESAFAEWARQYNALKDGLIDRVQYERWKDGFCADFSREDFPFRYERIANGDYAPIEPWANIRFSETLQRLRRAHDPAYTQADLASLTGTTESTIRSYEQKKRLPKYTLLQRIAAALDVTEGALTFFDFGSPVQAVHALFQLANVYGLVPDVIDGLPVLRTVQPGLEQIIDQWHQALAEYDQDALAYQAWKDAYDPENSRSDHESRYHAAWDSNRRMRGMESDYDRFDFKYKEGFLRA